MPISDLRSYRDRILELAAHHGARNVRVFGSVARGEDRSDSDIDFLVDVELGRSVLDVIGLQQDLEELLGRRVEVFTDGDLSPYMQNQVLAEAASL
jgi:predicted nucleotidyltransferase